MRDLNALPLVRFNPDMLVFFFYGESCQIVPGMQGANAILQPKRPAVSGAINHAVVQVAVMQFGMYMRADVVHGKQALFRMENANVMVS